MTEETEVITPETPLRNYGYMEEEAPPRGEEETASEVKTDAKPEVKPEIKAEVKPEEKPAAVAPDEKPAEITPVDWKAALKTADKYEALKELGYDDFTIGMLKYKEQTGDFERYVREKSADYTKMTPEQLIKTDLQRQNPGMSEKALNFKFNKELSEKYYLNRDDYPEDSDEAIYGQEQLRLDGENKRKAFIEEQNKFKAPEPQPDLDATRRDAELQQQKATLGSSVMNNEATTNLQKTKSIAFGEGEESFNYPIADPQALVDIALNTILNSGRTDLNGVDLNIFYKQLAKGQPDWEKSFAAHLKAVHKNQFQSELQNVTPPSGGKPTIEENAKDYSMKSS